MSQPPENNWREAVWVGVIFVACILAAVAASVYFGSRP